MRSISPLNGGPTDIAIKGNETATVMHGEGEEVKIGQLFRALHMAPMQEFRLGHADVTRPEFMTTKPLAEFGQNRGGVSRGQGARIRERTQNPAKTVFCNRAGSPSESRAMGAQPTMRLIVVQIGLVDERDEEVDIEEEGQTPSFSRISSTS
jgi:hypothetical protein